MNNGGDSPSLEPMLSSPAPFLTLEANSGYATSNVMWWAEYHPSYGCSTREHCMLHRIWDWIVGLTMIAIAIAVGGIIAALVAMPVYLGLAYLIDLQEAKGTVVWWCTWAGMFVILHSAGFYDFYRRGRANSVTGEAGFFHLIPRAIQRIRTGYELAGFVDEATGKPTTAEAPINAPRRGIVALLLTCGCVTAFLFGMQAKGDWAALVAAVGLIGALIGLALLLQVLLAYAGFIRRQ